MEQKFLVNQVVKGKVAGYFVVLGYRLNAFGDRLLVQVKPYDPQTGTISRGEMAFEEDSLVEVVSLPPLSGIIALTREEMENNPIQTE